jgi:hypothetical protein
MAIEMNLQKGLVGHWTMDAVDTSGGVIRDKTAHQNNATINGATSDHLGRIGTGFFFSGNGDEVVGPDIPATRSNPFTATAWVLIPDDYPSNVSGNMSPIAVRTNANTKWSVHYRNPNNTNSRQFQIFTENNGGVRTGDTFSEQKWHFVAVIDDGTDLKLRVNNTVYTDSGGGGTTFSSGGSEPFRIGGTGLSGEFWQGNIDNVRYYDRVLSDKELDTLYNIRSRRGFGSPYVPRRPVAAGDLAAWYPFEAGDGIDATAFKTWAKDNNDYSATVNGPTYQETGGITDIRRGKESGAFDFDGTDDTLDLGTVADSDQSLTMMMWIKPDAFGQSFRRFLTKADGSDVLNDGNLILATDSSGDTPQFFVNGTNTSPAPEGNPMTVDTYTHIAGRLDFQNGVATLFQNGQPVASDTLGAVSPKPSQPWRVGEDNPVGGTEFFDGTGDEVRIYTAALSDSQINQIYQNTRPDTVFPVAFENLVAWYPFRSGTGEDITAGDSRFSDTTDYSATVNGATFESSGGVTDIQTGANSGAFDFDGVDDTLDLGTVADSDQSLTFMAWFQPDVLGNFERLVVKADGNSFRKDGSIAFSKNRNDVVRSFVGTGGTTTVKGTTTAQVDTFAHYCVRYDFGSGELTVFFNGQPEGTKTVGQLNSFSSQPWRVGEFNPPISSDPVDGTIDGVRIYQAALSDSQINQIYLNTRPSLPVAAENLVAWYPFRAGTGVDLTAGRSSFGDTTDYSANVNGATYKPSGGVTDIQTGANSGAFDFDGVDDRAVLGTVADSDQSLTVMTWVRPDTLSKDFMRFLAKFGGSTFPQPGDVILSMDSDGDNAEFFIQGSTNAILNSPSPLPVNSYSHVAGRYDFQAGTTTLFVDGQPVANGSPGQAPQRPSQAWVIGENDPIDGSTFLNGTADDIRIYTAALSDSQINQIYLNTKP